MSDSSRKEQAAELESQLISVVATTESMRATVASSQSQMESKLQALRAFESNLSRSHAAIMALEHSTSRLRDDVTAHRSELDSLSAQAALAAAVPSSVTAAAAPQPGTEPMAQPLPSVGLATLDSKLRSALSRMSRTEDELSRTRGDLDALSATVVALRDAPPAPATLAAAPAGVAATDPPESAALVAATLTLSSKIRDISGEVAAVRRHADAGLADQDQRLNALARRMVQNERTVAAAKGQTAVVSAKLESLHSANLPSRVTALEDHGTKAETRIEVVSEDIATLRRTSQYLLHENASTKSALDDLADARPSATAPDLVTASLRDALASLRRDLSQLATGVVALKHAVENPPDPDDAAAPRPYIPTPPPPPPLPSSQPDADKLPPREPAPDAAPSDASPPSSQTHTPNSGPCAHPRAAARPSPRQRVVSPSAASLAAARDAARDGSLTPRTGLPQRTALSHTRLEQMVADQARAASEEALSDLKTMLLTLVADRADLPTPGSSAPPPDPLYKLATLLGTQPSSDKAATPTSATAATATTTTTTTTTTTHSLTHTALLTRSSGGGLDAVEARNLVRVIDAKADKDYADAIYHNLSSKFVQLATVASRNIEMLAHLVGRKADLADLVDVESSLNETLAAATRASSGSAAAGKLHFRCLTCNRFTRRLAGDATAAHRSALVPTPPHEPPHPRPRGHPIIQPFSERTQKS
ncbi:uncharacterized protein AMSG_07213 [Thecamonas trahens ATCC 50062]|uniref:Uncharacterized protein n=1 Tax=Thecamonas trahens ATCC 50062 TaxID=461836 RepID=A0A0L0DI34_THETB|nr:hypothetical protein AMSG_07213 [Thecamonas trahens ATCC 50062]KNC50958.1 hypothetical protein AMSG_07213 [Thecamonas trahens ATCC 50062]|eukprot:XP_013756654.1 hypothetical protein AMSG_07213 [Thecamonas trahens ATCC 50062]